MRPLREEPNAAKREHQATNLMVGETLSESRDPDDGHQDQVGHAGHCSALTESLGQDVRVYQVAEREDRKSVSEIAQRPEIGISFEIEAAACKTSAGGQQAQPGRHGHGCTSFVWIRKSTALNQAVLLTLGDATQAFGGCARCALVRSCHWQLGHPTASRQTGSVRSTPS